MPEKKKIIINEPQKNYFAIFLVITIIVVLIFAFSTLGFFGSKWWTLSKIKNYYYNLAQQYSQNLPQVNAYDPLKGPVDAKITIFEYSDFFCAACQQAQVDLTAIEKFYGTQVRFVYKGVAATVNLEAKPALTAAYCAAEQNKFWEYKILLLQSPLLLNKQKYLEYAGSLNLNLDLFNQCLQSDKYTSLITQNLRDLMGWQINTLPTIFVNEQLVPAPVNFNSIRAVIDSKLK